MLSFSQYRCAVFNDRIKLGNKRECEGREDSINASRKHVGGRIAFNKFDILPAVVVNSGLCLSEHRVR